MKKILIFIYSNYLKLQFKILEIFSIPFPIKYSKKILGNFYAKGQVSFGIWCGWFEKEEVEIFTRLITKCKTFIDIGANSGLYTIIASHEMKTINNLIAFEPSKTNFKYLSNNIELNKIDNLVKQYNF